MNNIGDMKMSELQDPSMKQSLKVGEYMTMLTLASRVGEVDMDRLIQLIMKAKGSRTMRKFADDMEVNVSTVSRIINGKVSEVSNALLAKIAAYADPESGITIEQLMEAQGLVSSAARENLAARYEDDCRRIIADELLRRGYSVNYSKSESRTNMGMIFDFEIQTDALERGGGRWLLEAKMFTEYGRMPIGIGSSRRWLDSAMAAFYRGEEAGRISIIVDHRRAFEQMKEYMSQYKIPDEISVILISTKKGRVLDEYIAPLTGERQAISVFSGTQEVED